MRAFLAIGGLLAMLAGHAAMAQVQEVVRERTRPFVNYTEVGGLFGRVVYDVPSWIWNGTTTVQSVDKQVENRLSLTIQTFNGVQLKPRLAVGGVVGVDWYSNALLMPVGAGIRYDLARPNQKNVQVFASADVGYGLTWLNQSTTGYELTRGGLMLNPGLGLRFGKPDKGAFLLTVSYKRQTVESAKPLQWNDIRRDESRVYNRLAVRLGVSF
ncbi:hypothetical protein FAES_0607 [Fibrella aestuarina BUZ 2]|uniref:Outer membrane protein beta-barrel domain-containing protein n=1 Tax=Fibrella aestuarina BUZ 2 TaxID=1166018 RepID=I0K3B5_9BACT|nr:hypothetical protein [Fibrella aestuarina]CCG98618.1 hypothetical protein FAES_0607 [Fibrella aestuarina BUZ 2]